jgi:hypothetical protein
VLYSDLSAHEKELLLKSSRKKSKEERQNERRFKRERDREKREYERKRRRERHGKHRRDGLVQEYLIPVTICSNFQMETCFLAPPPETLLGHSWARLLKQNLSSGNDLVQRPDGKLFSCPSS